jgi:hypothetical protein
LREANPGANPAAASPPTTTASNADVSSSASSVVNRIAGAGDASANVTSDFLYPVPNIRCQNAAAHLFEVYRDCQHCGAVTLITAACAP